MKTVKILGSGLSGLTAAINLVKANISVQVYEAKSDVGCRFQEDLQGIENWAKDKDALQDLKEMGIECNFDISPFNKITLLTEEKTLSLSLKKSIFYLVKRGTKNGCIDQGFKNQALKLGVKIHFDHPIPETEADIVSTGPIQKELAGYVKGIVFHTKHKDIAVELISNQAAYFGYSYLLITRGFGCLCTVVMKDVKKLDDCFDYSLKTFQQRFNFSINKPHPVGGVDCFSAQNKYQINNRLYIGEAAGIQDFLFGFGMRTAITSGYLAAQSIINHTDYSKIAREEFDPKIKAGIVNRYLWENYGIDHASLVLSSFKLSHDYSKHLKSFYNLNSVQKLIYPFAVRYIRKEYSHLKI